MRDLPHAADIVVVGGGTAGAVIAGRLIERTSRSVLVLEAGPDYGHYDEGRWPADLLDHRCFSVTHDWNYVSSSGLGKRGLRLERARVIGGCSSHNGCAIVWGHAADYDAWEAAGNPAWGSKALRPLFQQASARMSAHVPTRGEIGPFHEAALDAAIAAGYREIDEFNDLTGATGVAVNPLNVRGRVRWNAALAYLDPVRHDRRLRIGSNVTVDSVVIERGRATGVECIDADGDRVVVHASEVVLSAGTYATPGVLFRSGIGPAQHVRDLGVTPLVDLPGVGANLQDHVGLTLSFAGTADLRASLNEFVRAGGFARDEGTTVRTQSDLATDGYDLHIYALGRDQSDVFTLTPTNMQTRSHGTVRLVGRDPRLVPVIDSGFLSDEEDHDLAVVIDGVARAREIASSGPFGRTLGQEVGPAAGVSGKDLRRVVRAEAAHDFHPVGTCRMGPAADATAVVDSEGRLHGVEGLRVADASIMPSIPRANTNIPVVVIGERIASAMVG